MPRRNEELRERMKDWMREKSRTCQEPIILANLAAAWFKLYCNPKWVDDMAREVIEDESTKNAPLNSGS